MHPTARRSVVVAVLLWVLAVALLALSPATYQQVPGWLGAVLDGAVSFLQLALVPTGAVLIGVAVVVQTLVGQREPGRRTTRPVRRTVASTPASAAATGDPARAAAPVSVVPAGAFGAVPVAPTAMAAGAVPFEPSSALSLQSAAQPRGTAPRL